MMHFAENLQKLRKQKGLTQEELAAALFVSRTAVSKWESGRGYPNIESLKAIAKFFSVTIDELLSGEEVLVIAEEDHKQKETQLRDLVFGLLDLSAVMFFFLPFFGQHVDGGIQAVSLLALNRISTWLRIAYAITVIGIALSGIATLALQNCRWVHWLQNKSKLSLVLNSVGVFVFIISSQPYAAAFLFLILIIKAATLIKKQ